MGTARHQDEWTLFGAEKLRDIRVIISDIDGTLYRNQGYHADGTREEFIAVAEILGVSYDIMEKRIRAHRQELGVSFGRPAGMTETVMSLGITRMQWDELRCRVWQPEKWLAPDPNICKTLSLLGKKYRVAFGTNSPVAVGRRVLVALGIDKVAPVFGSDTLAVSKPHPDFFVRIAERLGFMPYHCITIGDRAEMDGTPAVAAGYAGAIIVSGGPKAFITEASQLLATTKKEFV